MGRQEDTGNSKASDKTNKQTNKQALGQASWVQIPVIPLGLISFLCKLGLIKILSLQEYFKE